MFIIDTNNIMEYESVNKVTSIKEFKKRKNEAETWEGEYDYEPFNENEEVTQADIDMCMNFTQLSSKELWNMIADATATIEALTARIQVLEGNIYDKN